MKENAALKEALTQRRQTQRQTYVPKPLDISEYETRRLYIDAMLTDAGWIRGRNWLDEVELPGMPNKSELGFADYVRTHRPELNVVTVNDQSEGPSADRFYQVLRAPGVIAAYSVRARNTIPLCDAALRLESERKLLLLGSDLFDQSAEMLRRGVLKGIVYKNPYQKGFLGLKVLVEQLLMDKPPRTDRLFVQISVIMRNNLVFFEEFI